jgi:hypothetical protein
MDISINGIHYINLDKLITSHIKKCHSIEFQQSLLWLSVQNTPSSMNELKYAFIESLTKISKSKS